MISARNFTQVYAADIGITDIIIAGANNPCLCDYIKDLGVQHGDKQQVTASQFNQLISLTAPHEITYTAPGASSANTLVTLGRILSPLLGNVNFGNYFAIIGQEDTFHAKNADRIRHDFKSAGITCVEPANQNFTPAMSACVTFGDGERAILTTVGQTPQHMNVGALPKIHSAGALFISMSLAQKAGWDVPRAMLGQAHAIGSEVWIALPTNKDFATQHQRECVEFIAQADVIMCNRDELGKAVAARREYDQDFYELQAMLLASKRRKPLTFVTDGLNDAHVVGQSWIERIPITPISPQHIKGKTGAGDTAFAGFLLHRYFPHDLMPAQAGEIGIALAHEKIRLVKNARLPDPLATLTHARPDLAQLLVEASHNLHALRA